MNIHKSKITEHIFLLEFNTQVELASTFLRFQEYYESPEFRNKIFTLDEYKKWYIKWKGTFSYYTDWSGFNIPSYALKPFYDGKFDPLSEQEKQFLELFKDEKGKFYIIGVIRNSTHRLNSLKHELAHALFYIDSDYKLDVPGILNKYDVKKIKENIIRKGYCEEVLNDEVNAYAIGITSFVKSKYPEGMQQKLIKIFEKYLDKHKIKL